MKISQLYAISYSNSRREREKAIKEIETRGFSVLFRYQKHYKTEKGFLNATPDRLKECKKEAVSAYEARIEQLTKSWTKKDGSMEKRNQDYLKRMKKELSELKKLKF